MKQFYLYVMCLVTSVGFCQVSDLVSFKASAFELKEKGGLTTISTISGSAYVSQPGAPRLPVFTYNYVLPQGGVVSSVSVDNGNKILLGSKLKIIPAQRACELNGKPCDDSTTPDPAIYTTDSPFPAETVKLGGEVSMYGYNVVTIEVTPFHYLPKSGNLYLYQNLSITVQYNIGPIEYQARITEGRHKLTKEVVQSLIQNPDDISTLAKTSNVVLDASNHTGKLHIPWNPSPYGDVPDYIVITSETLKPYFEPFVTNKIQRGIPTLLVTVEEIYQKFPGFDNAEKIRNYLKKAHKYWGAGLFVLLGGDTAEVPGRIGMLAGANHFNYTDMYYCDVYMPGNPNYNWNQNGNADFYDQQVELGPENFIGRAPVDTAEEAQNFVEKVISYEQLSGVSEHGYVNNMLFLGSYYSYNHATNTGIGIPYGGQQWHYNLANQPFLANPNLNKWLLFDDFVGPPHHNFPGNEELSRPTTLDRMSNGSPGIGKFHLVSHYDHGSAYGIGVSSGMKGHGIYRPDMDALSNGNYFQIMYTTACDDGEFEKDCFAEHYVNATNGGGVAILANSGTVSVGAEQQSHKLFHSIYGSLSNNSHVLGIAHANARGAVNSPDRIKKLTLFGDPTMRTWSATPQLISLVVPESISIDNNIPNILPIAINPLDEVATISLYKFNNVTNAIEVYAEQNVAAGTTSVQFTLHPDTEGTLTTMVTAKNYLPAVGTTNILLPQAHLYVTGYSIVDGNLNGIVEQGETVTMMVNLTNSGNTNITGINTVLSSNPIFASVTADQVSYNQINAGQTVQLVAYTFVAQQSDGVIQFPDYIEFFLDITADDNFSHLDNFYIDLKNTALSLGSRQISDVAGNMVTELIPNVDTFLKISLNNIGSCESGIMSAALSSSLQTSGIVEIIESASTYGNIDVFQSQLNSSPFIFKFLQPHSGSKPFTLTVTSSFGQVWTFNFDLNDVQPPLINNFRFTSLNDEITLKWDPISNIQGYNIYRSTSENGTYDKINNQLISGTSSYNDTGLAITTVYFYKISVVALSGNERTLENVVTNDNPPKQGYPAWTSLNNHGGFPIEVAVQSSCSSPVTIFDVDNNGHQELFVNYSQGESQGKIMGFYDSGQEMYNIDGNETTVSGFASTNIAMMSNSAVGDLDNDGNAEVLSIGRNNTLNHGRVFVYKTTDANGDSVPDKFWTDETIEIGHRVWRNPVLYDVDGNGFLDIILVDEHQKIFVFDKDKNIMPGWPIQIGSADYAMGHIAVADLDGDGKGEIALGIAAGSNNKGAIYIWNHDGSNFTTNPFKEFAANEKADAGIVFADIDNDLSQELLITTRLANIGRIYAFNLDGTAVNAAWNGATTFNCTTGTYEGHIQPRIAVGDLNSDGNLEICFGSKSQLFLLNSSGVSMPNFPKPIVDMFDHAPALADIDTDADVEIIINNSGILQAYNLDASPCVGFPLVSNNASPFVGTPAIADLDGDGYSEVAISTANGSLHVFNTTGDPDNIEWGSYRGNARNTGTYKEVCNGLLDLMVRDKLDDNGDEPNTVTEFFWTSDDIWIRNSNDNILEHENAEYSGNSPSYIKVRVTNRSCVPSTGSEELAVYWAKSGTSHTYPNPWLGGLFSPVTGASMGGVVGTLNIPVLQPGQEIILTFPWLSPDPANYGDFSDQWHFCLLAKIIAANDPMAVMETGDLNANVANNNNIAWKNIAVVDVLPNNIIEPGAVISVGNPFGFPKSFYLELVIADAETGKPIYEEAEVGIKMDDILYNAWVRGGKEAELLESTNEEKKKIAKGNQVLINNISFEGKELGTLRLSFNFLTKELTSKENYIYHAIQRETGTGRIIGGNTFAINKNPRTPFIADAGDDKIVDLNQSIIISAGDINEPAIYRWYDSSGELVFEGQNLEIANAVSAKYKLEVISTVDGFKDYAEVEVKLKPNRLESIAPNPAINNVSVAYKLNNATSAYIMVMSYYMGGGISNNYMLDVGSKNETTLNLSNYPLGFYKVVLVADGEVVDAKILFKQ